MTALLPDWEAMGLRTNAIEVMISFGFRKLQVKGVTGASREACVGERQKGCVGVG